MNLYIIFSGTKPAQLQCKIDIFLFQGPLMTTALRISNFFSCFEERKKQPPLLQYEVDVSSFETITYHLRAEDFSSDHFYATLKDVAKSTLDKIYLESEDILHQYEFFLEEDLHERKRSYGEYAIEFLTIGITWRCYCHAVQNTSRFILPVLSMLFKMRSKYSPLKRYIDTMRGKITTRFIVPHLKKSPQNTILNGENFDKLVKWLSATGEFKDEVRRFGHWQLFFETITSDEKDCYLKKTTFLVDWFEEIAKAKLGGYTQHIEQFTNTTLSAHRGKEDILFCGKSEIEYHINMIASEIMNQGLRNDFLQTKEKTVLVPGCMRSQPENTCKAIQLGDDITCTHCTKNCNVNRITSLGKQNGFKTFIVPHSSGFTKWLKRFSDQNENGIVAVACTLNIVAGGYEMRELNIPSQCVMLDYCGCKKHWHEKGFATDVNDRQLMKVLNS
jgi:hypothetical protein